MTIELVLVGVLNANMGVADAVLGTISISLL